MLARQSMRATSRLLGVAPKATRRYVAELRPTISPAFSTAAEAFDVSTAAREPKPAPRAYPLPRRAPSPPKPVEEQQSESAVAAAPPQQQQQPQKNQHIAPEPPAADSSQATTTNVEKPKRRPLRPLRPRKAAMKLSEAAVAELRRLLDLPEPKLIKVGVKQKGCSGLTYDLEYVDAPGKMDEVVEQDGVKIVIDSRALMSVIGSEMHWEEDLLSRKFVFRNPNISKLSLLVLGLCPSPFLILYTVTLPGIP
ncbi:related to iron sulfur assembly protein 1 [Cephalotrichum gorgonifer]|uniref:Related to iron sulfur assembly protein 1 n=1 Tax=Cephalotrichum gorgonifer TaxID=2041049 RepID=A0AAE8SXR8_9PEZI|nr:related to iron sulfur assembly protein 1 [Cephalotrichum gorgonifer]